MNRNKLLLCGILTTVLLTYIAPVNAQTNTSNSSGTNTSNSSGTNTSNASGGNNSNATGTGYNQQVISQSQQIINNIRAAQAANDPARLQQAISEASKFLENIQNPSQNELQQNGSRQSW